MVDVSVLAVPAYVVENRGPEGYVFTKSNSAAFELWTGNAGVAAGPVSLSEVFSPAIARRVADSFDLCLRSGRPLERDSTVPSPRGYLNLRTTMYPLLRSDAGWPRLLCMVSDITEERRVRDNLHQSNARLAVAMDALGGAHWFYDVVRRTFELGPSFSRILGSRYRAVMGMDEWLTLVHPDDRDDPSFIDLLDGVEHSWSGEYRILDASGGVRWLRCFRRAVTKGSLVSGIAGVVVDITADKQREAALIEQALTDPLTGLANRRGLERILSSRMQGVMPLCFVMIDVDEFKAFNDSQGHIAGDEVLRCVGATIAALVSPVGGVVARYGGEEFVVVVPLCDQVGARELATGLLESVSRMALPHAMSERGFITISAGYALKTDDRPIASFVAMADAALYRAKRDGRNCCRGAEPLGVDDGRAVFGVLPAPIPPSCLPSSAPPGEAAEPGRPRIGS